MGRFEKAIILENGIDRRESGYYSTPEFISRFMFEACIEINPNGRYAFDPAVGNEELVRNFSFAGIQVDGLDIVDYGEYENCNFIQRDFLDFYEEFKRAGLFSQSNFLKYDYIVANPPYNCHEVNFIRDNKKRLQNLFPKVGVFNMYSMFLSAIVDMASEGTIMSLIVSDSFLTSTAHRPLREQILNLCSIHYLILCPSDLFRDQKADVRTCILVLQKGKLHQGHVKTLNRTANKFELETKLLNRDFEKVPLPSIVSSSDTSKEIVVGVSNEIHDLFSLPKLGQLFKCITGISTGNDKLFLSGEKKDGFTIPFFKNPGSKKFYCEPNCYLTDDYLTYDLNIKDFMVRNKTYLLKSGITCSSMGVVFSACYLPAGSTFGVNPNIIADDEDVWWLNSSLVTYLVRGVLCRSNMITSGYVARIPVVQFSNEIKKNLSRISRDAYESKIQYTDFRSIISKIDTLVFKEINLTPATISEILNFSQNLLLRV